MRRTLGLPRRWKGRKEGRRKINNKNKDKQQKKEDVQRC
jgi:hypothetical protein